MAVDWLQRNTLQDVSFPGEDFGFEPVSTALQPGQVADACDTLCQRSPNCVAWTYAAPPAAPSARCLLKRTVPPAAAQDGALSGVISSRYLAIRRTGAAVASDTPDRIVRLPWASPVNATVAMRILLDRTIVEAFVDGVALTMRFYPPVSSDGVTLAGPEGTLADVSIWELP